MIQTTTLLYVISYKRSLSHKLKTIVILHAWLYHVQSKQLSKFFFVHVLLMKGKERECHTELT